MKRIFVLIGTSALVLLLSVPLFAVTKQTPRQQYRGAVLVESRKSKNRWYVDPRAMKRYCFRTETDVRKFIRSRATARRVFRQTRRVVGKKKLIQIPVAQGHDCSKPKVVIIPVQRIDTPEISSPETPIPPSRPPIEPPLPEPAEPPVEQLPIPSIPPEPSPTSSQGSSISLLPPVQAFVDLVNARRRVRGITEVNVDASVTAAAQLFAEKKYALTSDALLTALREQGYHVASVSAFSIEGRIDVATAFERWIASDQSEVTADIPTLNDIGIGYVTLNDGRTTWFVLITESQRHLREREVARIEAALADRVVVFNTLLAETNAVRAQCNPSSRPLPKPDAGCPDQQLEAECSAPLAPLTMHALLGNAAQGHADDMKARIFFDHVNPSGEDVDVRVERAGYVYQLVGENLLCGNRIDTPRKAVAGWLKSCGHRKTLLSPDWTEAGFGLSIARGKHCGAETEDEFAVYWVQNFGSPK